LDGICIPRSVMGYDDEESGAALGLRA
jgi:hypothetical protein